MEKFSQNRTHCLCFWHGVCPEKAVKVEMPGKEELKQY